MGWRAGRAKVIAEPKAKRMLGKITTQEEAEKAHAKF